jgi:hypothetical protein
MHTRPTRVALRSPGPSSEVKFRPPERHAIASKPRQTRPPPWKQSLAYLVGGRRGDTGSAVHGDCVTGRGKQPPSGPEAVAALTLGRPWAGVNDEVVQRVALVCHLPGTVSARDHANVSRPCFAARCRPRARDQRGPCKRAIRRAIGPSDLVTFPHVQRSAGAIGQISPVPTGNGADRDRAGRAVRGFRIAAGRGRRCRG